MKRTLTVLTAAFLASAIAIPAFAQTGGSSTEARPAAAASPSSEKPTKKHHHSHKKKADSGSMAPASTAK